MHELFGKWNEGVFCGRSSSAKSIWRTGEFMIGTCEMTIMGEWLGGG